MFSCAQGTKFDIPPEPENLLSQEKFTEVMLDMQLLEASIRIKLLRQKGIRERTPGYFEQVFTKHQVKEKDFTSSLKFYAAQHEKITAIYDSVEVRLIRMKEEGDTRQNPDLIDALETP